MSSKLLYPCISRTPNFECFFLEKSAAYTRVNTVPGGAVRVAGALLQRDEAAQERVRDRGKHPTAGGSRGPTLGNF